MCFKYCKKKNQIQLRTEECPGESSGLLGTWGFNDVEGSKPDGKEGTANGDN